MIKEKYKEYQLCSFKKEFIELGKDIIDKNYRLIHRLKDTPRNYVAIIEWKDKKYVLKEPRNEYRIPQRQFLSFFKDGEALSTLKNIHELIYKYDFKEFIEIFLSGTRRKNGFIIDSFFVMEYVSAEIQVDSTHKDRAVELMKKVHSKGYYHGDCNPSNFIFDREDNIRIIDTKGDKGSAFSKHYDMITMKYDSYQEMAYPYPKDFWFYVAHFLKVSKKIPLIQKIKLMKKRLRDRGWKI